MTTRIAVVKIRPGASLADQIRPHLRRVVVTQVREAVLIASAQVRTELGWESRFSDLEHIIGSAWGGAGVIQTAFVATATTPLLSRVTYRTLLCVRTEALRFSR